MRRYGAEVGTLVTHEWHSGLVQPDTGLRPIPSSDLNVSVCLWDLASLDVADWELCWVARHVREAINLHSGKTSEKGFIVACDVRSIAPSTSRALNRIPNLDLLHVSATSAEEKLKQKLHQFDIDYRHAPGTVALITGNPNFAMFLANMSRSGWRTLLFHPPTVSQELVQCVDFHQDLFPVLETLAMDPSIPKPTSLTSMGEPSYLLIANLPLEQPSHRIIALLQVSYVRLFTCSLSCLVLYILDGYSLAKR